MAYTWDEDKKNLSVVVVNGETYYVKDKEARDAIDSVLRTVNEVMHWRGISSTDPTTGTVTINGEVLTPEAGDVVGYNTLSGEQLEYAYNGSAWDEFGSTGTLKAFAFADTGTVKFTPNVNKGTLDVTQGNFSGSDSIDVVNSVTYPNFSAPTSDTITTKSTNVLTNLGDAVAASMTGETLTLGAASTESAFSSIQEVDTINKAVTSVTLGAPTYGTESKTITISGTTTGIGLTGEIAGVEQTETVNPTTT